MKTTSTVRNILPISLDNLHLEIIGSYAAHLELKDVVHLSMTCRRLHSDIQGSRRLWLELLHAIFDREGISRNTFDTSSMSLADIKRLSTRPSRLYHAIQKKKPVNLSHTFFRLLPDHNYVGVWSNVMNASTNITVLPGGRYLIGLAWVDGAYQFFVWDLSHLPPGNSEERILSSVATLRFDHYEIEGLGMHAFRMQADPTNQRTVVLLVCCSDTGTLTIEVNALNWPSNPGDAPKFVRVNHLKVTGISDFRTDVTKVALEGDIVLLRAPSLVAPYLVWDWKNHAIIPINFNFDGRYLIGPVWAHPRGAYTLDDFRKRIGFYHFDEFTPLDQNHHLDEYDLETGVRLQDPIFQSLPNFHALSDPEEEEEEDHIDIRVQNMQPFITGRSILHASNVSSDGTQALWLRTLTDPPPKTSEDDEEDEETDVKFVDLAHEVVSHFPCYQTFFHLLDPDMLLILLTVPRAQPTDDGNQRRFVLKAISGVTQSISKGYHNVDLNTDIPVNAVQGNPPVLVALPCFRSGVFLCSIQNRPYRYCLLRYD